MTSVAPVEPPKSPGVRRWLQFRLRTLLILILVAAVALAWYQSERRRLAGVAPTQWDVKKGNNIKWAVDLGTRDSSPVVAGDKVFVGSNNMHGYVPRFPAKIDLSVMLCFRADDGEFLWQATHPRLPTGRIHDYPHNGIPSRPLVEGNRLWYVSNRCEVVCLDTEGFYDDENDGPVVSETVDRREADVVWTLDMFNQLGVRPHEQCPCWLAADDRRLFVVTGNGIDQSHTRVQAPQAPSFLAIDKQTGQVLWSDNSPGANIMHSQWGSPTYAVLGGVPQVIFPGGDGWVYSFDPAGTPNGKSKLLWKFDINPKRSVFALGGRGTRNEQSFWVNVAEERVYLTTGQDPEHGDGPGCIWCLDPTKRGDVSSELVLNPADPTQPVPPRRITPVDPAAGDYVAPNPNSAVLWRYEGCDLDGDGTLAFTETMHRSLSGVSVNGGVLIAADYSGIVHCMNAKTGQALWTHDLLATSWCPTLISGGHAYVSDEDGDVCIFKLPTSEQEMAAKQMVGEMNMGNSVLSRPTVANQVLYIAARGKLYAIAKLKKGP